MLCPVIKRQSEFSSLLRCDAMSVGKWFMMFRRIIVSSYSMSIIQKRMFVTDDESIAYLLKVGTY